MKCALFLLVAACGASDPTPTVITSPPVPPVVPVVAPARTDDSIASLDAGTLHTCVARYNGHVACWGDNREGQLGDGTHVTRDRPTDVTGVDGIEVTAGEHHTCARDAKGGVTCWGENTSGQLGDGTTDERPRPVTVANLRAAVEIAAGKTHTCARHSDGAVSCWGANERGQLGDGTVVDRDAPVPVPGITDAVHVVAGGFTTCVLRQSGAVACWGENTSGELGIPHSRQTPGTVVTSVEIGIADGPTGGHAIMEERWLQTQPVPIPIVDAVALDLSEHVGCAIHRTGVVSCWGANIFEQLATKNPNATRADIAAAKDAVEIAAGNLRVCARFADGKITCWGAFIDRRPDATEESFKPPTVKPLPAAATRLTAGDMHECALLVTGAVMCWGDNQLQQLGGGNGVNSDLGTIAGAKGATQLSSGYEHACALRDGHVLCWPNQDPVGHAPPPKDVGVTSAIQIASGAHHDCAVLASKQVACWGDPFAGVLGHGKQGASTKPVLVKGITDAVEVAASNTHTCARHASGKISCWGDNVEGFLGVGNKVTPQLVPVSIPGITDAVQLALGVNHTCARLASHKVICWGDNEDGELGDGTTQTRTAPVAVQGLPKTVDEITGGSTHNCARSGGTLWCWGNNSNGQLGDGTTTSHTKAVQVPSITDAIAVSAADSDHTCAVRKTGAVLCWGENGAFQLGSGSGPSRPIPQDVATLRDAVSLGVGGIESCALRKTGDVACWSRIQPQDKRGMESSEAAIAVAF